MIVKCKVVLVARLRLLHRTKDVIKMVIMIKQTITLIDLGYKWRTK